MKQRFFRCVRFFDHDADEPFLSREATVATRQFRTAEPAAHRFHTKRPDGLDTAERWLSGWQYMSPLGTARSS